MAVSEGSPGFRGERHQADAKREPTQATFGITSLSITLPPPTRCSARWTPNWPCLPTTRGSAGLGPRLISTIG